MFHLSELHGAATRLAVLAIPVFAFLHLLRRLGLGGVLVRGAEPWALGAAVIGVAWAGITGLLVWGQAQTMLRGGHFRIGTVHFWLGILIAVLVVAAVVDWYRVRREAGAERHPPIVPALAAILVAAVAVQGYYGGRMTYVRGVGVADGGEFLQSAIGADRLHLAEARGVAPVVAGRQAFSADGLGCSRCHGDRAQGTRGPRLAGGRDVAEFRHVHEHGLFPRRLVTDRDFAAIDAWLKTLGPPGRDD